MSIRDKFNMFSEDQVITATANSTNVVDMGTAQQRDGSTRTIKIYVTEAFNTLTSLTIAFFTSAAEAMTSPQDSGSRSVPLAGLGLGDVVEIPIPANCLRYGRMTYTVVGTDPTTGILDAGIGLDGIQTNLGD